MAASGFISQAEAQTASARPLAVRPPPDFFRDRSPYFAEHIRRDIGKRYGEKALWEGGLQVETTLVPWVDEAAQENVDFSLRKLDKRQGWRGPVTRLQGRAADEFRRRVAQRYGAEPPLEGRLYLGLVEASAGSGAQVRVGEKTYLLPSAGMQWAAPFSLVDSTNGRVVNSTAGLLKPGDVIWVANAIARACAATPTGPTTAPMKCSGWPPTTIASRRWDRRSCAWSKHRAYRVQSSPTITRAAT